jgi:4-hydroxy-tetrahydrodipicolinate reductase
MINVLINGANGKMGKAIIKVIEENPSYRLRVSALRDHELKKDGPFDLLIDFSLPEGAKEAFELAKAHHSAFLTGTTNMPAGFVETLKAEKSIPVFYSPNVSIGVFLFTKLIKEADILFAGYTKQIHEIHHIQKVDAPSGTAKNLALAINFPAEKITYERVNAEPGTHSLKLVSPLGDEEITLTHRVIDRVLLANSAVKIGAWLAKQKPGFYDMTLFTEGLQ